MEAATNIDIWKVIWESGLVVKFVLFLLLFASVMSWAIVFKKRKALKYAHLNNNQFLDMYMGAQSLTEVMEKADAIAFSPYKQMFIHGHRELTKVRETSGEGMKIHFQNYGFGVIERALKKGVNESSLKLERYLSVLASIGSVTPFVGLFGTVWGIIDSFTGLASGGATIDAVAPGIAEALVATAVGLFAAIPAVWFYNHFTNQISVINTQMETFGQEFLNVVERSVMRD
ncbi:MAG: protein TolQ [Bacteriovoracaceae bacterium]|nr:protein TolQ [Bacteriovoracaceae bacterium]